MLSLKLVNMRKLCSKHFVSNATSPVSIINLIFYIQIVGELIIFQLQIIYILFHYNNILHVS